MKDEVEDEPEEELLRVVFREYGGRLRFTSKRHWDVHVDDCIRCGIPNRLEFVCEVMSREKAKQFCMLANKQEG